MRMGGEWGKPPRLRAGAEIRLPKLPLSGDMLPGADAGDGVVGQGRGCQALAGGYGAAAGKVKVQIIKTRRPAILG